MMSAPAASLPEPLDTPIPASKLAEHTGVDSGKPIYVAIKGTVFDVTAKREMYGPGGSYSVFAGKDGSRGLGMSSLKPEDAVADYSGLDDKQIKVRSPRPPPRSMVMLTVLHLDADAHSVGGLLYQALPDRRQGRRMKRRPEAVCRARMPESERLSLIAHGPLSRPSLRLSWSYCPSSLSITCPLPCFACPPPLP